MMNPSMRKDPYVTGGGVCTKGKPSSQKLAGRHHEKRLQAWNYSDYSSGAHCSLHSRMSFECTLAALQSTSECLKSRAL